ncbi:MAG: hypothetical protein Q4E57_01945 [Eubacteriales bacterium]|nr:hypothetical protein [Eubacteriales bacterium]
MKKLLTGIISTAVLTAAFATISFAAVITEVKISCGPDDTAEMVNGAAVAPDFYTDSEEYTIESCGLADPESQNFKDPETYVLRLSAADGNSFPANADALKVTAGGDILSIVKTTIIDDAAIDISVKAYPYYKWPKPEFTNEDLESTKISFTKNGAPSVQYIIEYVDHKGDEKGKTGKTTGSSITISSYNKAYTGNKPDHYDMYIKGIAIRAMGNAGSNEYTAPSDWVVLGDLDPSDYDFTMYDTWSEVRGTNAPSAGSMPAENGAEADAAGAAASGTGSSSNSEGNGKSDGNNDSDGSDDSSIAFSVATIIAGADYSEERKNDCWVGDENDWRYIEGGSFVKDRWVDSDGYRYRIGPVGSMLYGWFKDDSGNLYYLSDDHDGTFGHVVTGAFTTPDGVLHYFSEQRDDTYGRLLQ